MKFGLQFAPSYMTSDLLRALMAPLFALSIFLQQVAFLASIKSLLAAVTFFVLIPSALHSCSFKSYLNRDCALILGFLVFVTLLGLVFGIYLKAAGWIYTILMLGVVFAHQNQRHFIIGVIEMLNLLNCIFVFLSLLILLCYFFSIDQMSWVVEKRVIVSNTNVRLLFLDYPRISAHLSSASLLLPFVLLPALIQLLLCPTTKQRKVVSLINLGFVFLSLGGNLIMMTATAPIVYLLVKRWGGASFIFLVVFCNLLLALVASFFVQGYSNVADPVWLSQLNDELINQFKTENIYLAERFSSGISRLRIIALQFSYLLDINTLFFGQSLDSWAIFGNYLLTWFYRIGLMGLIFGFLFTVIVSRLSLFQKPQDNSLGSATVRALMISYFFQVSLYNDLGFNTAFGTIMFCFLILLSEDQRPRDRLL